MYTHKPIRFVRCGISRAMIACLFTLAIGMLIPSLSAQSGKGTITGHVTNQTTGLPLEGALVALEGESLKALTGKDGSYRLGNVPSGSNTVIVAYTGLDTSRVTVNVSSGSTAEANVGMTSDVYTLESFQVSAVREDQAAAINAQHNASNVKNVVATNAYGNVGESNLGNLLIKLPGVTPNRDEGDVHQISIRGINPNLNSVSVDGTLLAGATTRGDNRAFEIDKVSSNAIKSIEVIKSPTPDMDADSIGGKINLITKDGFEAQGREISYTIAANNFVEMEAHTLTGAILNSNTEGSNGTIKRFRSHPSGSIVYSDIFGKNDNIALVLTGSFNRSFSPRTAFRADYFDAGPVDTFGGGTVGGGKPLKNFQHTEDDILLDRLGLSGKLTFKTGENSKFFISAMHNDFTDIMTQHKMRVFLRNEELDAANPFQESDDGKVYAVMDETVTEFTDGEMEYEMESRQRTVTTNMIQLGGENNSGNWEIDYDISNSSSYATELREDLVLRVKGVGYRLDSTYDNQFPRITQTSGPNVRNYDNAYVDGMDERDLKAWDDVTAGQLNVKRILNTEVPMFVKAGVRYRSQEKRQDRRRPRWVYVGPDGIPGPDENGISDDGLQRFADDGRREDPVEGRYTRPLWPDWLALHDERRLKPELFYLDPDRVIAEDRANDRTAKEDITSAYVMGEMTKDKFSALLGVRVEKTETSGISPLRNRDADNAADEWGETTTSNGSYTSTFPGLHLKYDSSDQLVFRASFSTSIGRPNFDRLIPGTDIREEDLRIEINNPDLKPMFSDNIDLSAEYYMKGIGLLSVGYFTKSITDFEFDDNYTVGSGADNGFGGMYEGFEVSTAMNGGWADVNGLEFNYQQHFTYLPGILNAFGVFANYTLLDTKGTYDGDTIVNEVQGFVEKSGNFGLSYIKHGWTVRGSASYKGENIDDDTGNPIDNRYQESRTQLDLSVLYRVKPSMSIFVDFLNLTNQHNTFYRGFRTRQANSQIYGRKITAGISGKF